MPARPAGARRCDVDGAPPETVLADGVILRRVTAEDAAAVARAVRVSLAHLRPWMAWAGDDAPSEPIQRAQLLEAARSWDDGREYRYAVLDPEGGELLGLCSLHRRIGPGGLEIGYWVHVDHVGRGVATAAARALTELALALPDIDRVEIRCDEANRASAAIPRKLGYRLDRVDDKEVGAPGESGRNMVWVFDRRPRDGDSAPEAASTGGTEG